MWRAELDTRTIISLWAFSKTWHQGGRRWNGQNITFEMFFLSPLPWYQLLASSHPSFSTLSRFPYYCSSIPSINSSVPFISPVYSDAAVSATKNIGRWGGCRRRFHIFHHIRSRKDKKDFPFLIFTSVVSLVLFLHISPQVASLPLNPDQFLLQAAWTAISRSTSSNSSPNMRVDERNMKPSAL